jgi:HSP20 family protein
MLVRYWQPWRELETLRRQFDQVFDELAQTSSTEQMTWAPAIELHDGAEALTLRVQLPGIDANSLDIQVSREAASLSGEHRFQQKFEAKGVLKSEFRYGKFQRVIPLPVAVQNNQVKADYTDGILTLTLPKVVEAQMQAVKVSVGSGSPTVAIGATEQN